MKVQLLLTGNELMTGDIVDSNSAMIAQSLSNVGIFVERRVTLPDDRTALREELRQMTLSSDAVIVNGGLGPTEDDLTAEVLAEVMNAEVVQHPDALAHLTSWCERRNYRMDGPNLKQTMLPLGVDIIPNPVGSAAGFQATVNNCLVMCTPGVPSELSAMLSETITPCLSQRLPESEFNTIRRLRVFGYGESNLQRLLSQNIPEWPESVELGFRASLPMLELKLRVASKKALPELERLDERIRAILGHHVVTDDERPLATVLQDQLIDAGKKVTFAESCTGGLIASMMTEQPGSSRVFEAGFVVYANTMKQDLLGVSPETLETHGAVSEQTVIEMLGGALRRSKADLGVAVSGVAGPGGGTEAKPVGTVWLAWGGMDSVKTAELYIPASRSFFQKIVAAMALDLLRRELISEPGDAIYLKERKRKS